jgi:Leucine-rich repeat (LRR) protein
MTAIKIKLSNNRRYVQNNSIADLRGLDKVPKLQVLNISSNHLTDLEGIEACPELNTLVCSGNKLATLASVSHLRQCPHLNTLDLQSNLLEDPEVLSQPSIPSAHTCIA